MWKNNFHRRSWARVVSAPCTGVLTRGRRRSPVSVWAVPFWSLAEQVAIKKLHLIDGEVRMGWERTENAQMGCGTGQLGGLSYKKIGNVRCTFVDVNLVYMLPFLPSSCRFGFTGLICQVTQEQLLEFKKEVMALWENVGLLLFACLRMLIGCMLNHKHHSWCIYIEHHRTKLDIIHTVYIYIYIYRYIWYIWNVNVFILHSIVF